MKKIARHLSVCVAIALPASAATTITFDNTIATDWNQWSNYTMPYLEGGFSLNSSNNGNIRFFEGTYKWVGNVGSANGTDMAAVVGGNLLQIVSADGSSFSGTSVQLGNVNTNSYSITASGYDSASGGNLMASQTFTLGAGNGFSGNANWQTFIFSGNFADVRRLELNFPASGNSLFVGVENIVLNGTIPEPSSLALLGCGALLALRRRRI